MRTGVDSTPTIFVNGRRILDKSRESLKAAIEAALKEVTGPAVGAALAPAKP
jgi:hypothetical protein